MGGRGYVAGSPQLGCCPSTELDSYHGRACYLGEAVYSTDNPIWNLKGAESQCRVSSRWSRGRSQGTLG